MAWPYLTGTIKVVIKYVIGQKPMINVTFAKRTLAGIIEAGDLQAVAEAAETAWWTNWSAMANEGAEVVEIETTEWDDENGQLYTLVPSPAIEGAKTGGIVTNQVALVVTHKTGLTGRSARGRSYIPGLDEVDLNATSVITAQVLTDAVEIFSLFATELDTADYNHVVLSLYHDGAERATPIAFQIDEYTTNSRVDTQRRRLPK